MMKRLIKFTCLFFVAMSSFSKGEANSEPLTLEKLQKLVLEKSPELQALQQEVDETRALSGRSRSAYFPTLGVAGGVERESSSENTQQVALGYVYANYNLFRGFQDRYQSDIASAGLRRAEVRLNKAKLRISQEITQKYYLSVLRKKAAEIKKQALDLNQTHKAMAKRRQAASMASVSDVMEFDLREAFLQSEVALLEQELKSALLDLEITVGSENSLQLILNGDIPHFHLKEELSYYLQQAQKESETLLVVRQELSMAEISANRWKAKWLPSVDLQIQAGQLPIENRPQNGGMALSGMLLAKIDLFSGFDTVWERRELIAKQQKQEIVLKQEEIRIKGQIERAYTNLRTIQSRIHFEEQNSARAKKYYEAVLKEYSRGIKNAADVKVASEVLFEALLKPDRFKYEFIDQLVQLQKLLGISLDLVSLKGQEDH